MHKGIGWVTAFCALTGCATGPETGTGVGYVGHVDPGDACALTGGTLAPPRAGATCGKQSSGETCIWSPMAVEMETQMASARCGDRDCACVTLGDIHQACDPSPPTCTCGEGALYLDEATGCVGVETLEASFETASAGELLGREGVWMMYRGGGIDSVAHYADATSLLEAHSWLGASFREACTLERGTPAHDCDAGFGDASGCYLAASGHQARVSQRMADLVTYAERDYADDSIERARTFDERVEATVTVVDTHLRLHFGRDEDGWKLLVIDATTFDCGA